MDRETLIENFVRKREDWRKTSFGLIMCTLIYSVGLKIMHNRLSLRAASFCDWVLLLLVLALFVVSFYVGKVLSVCPVCHRMIPTTRGRHQSLREKPRFFGNGPLPDYCPHCGANFVKYKTCEFEQY